MGMDWLRAPTETAPDSTPRRHDGPAESCRHSLEGLRVINYIVVINERSAGSDWRLCQTGFSRWRGEYTSAVLDGWADLEAVERDLGLVAGQPFILRPDGTPDPDVTSYFGSRSFRRLAKDTQHSYASDLKIFLSFLERHGTDWRDASHDTWLDYEYWRRRDSRNPGLVGGSKFARESAACGHFFLWQVSRGTRGTSPIVPGRLDDGRPVEAEQTSLRPANIRSVKVKWLTPRAYRRWRDVGMAGYLADGLPQENWRGRTDGRNLAMTDLMWASGLRLREAGTLLVPELPRAASGEKYVRGRIAEAVAKGSAREYWVSRKALQRIDGYVRSTRSAAVRRAQEAGRYDADPERRVVTSLNRRGDITFVDEQGRSTQSHLDALDAELRRSLFTVTPAGLEPLALWLTEAGDPMPYRTWEALFSNASDRCEREGVPIRCHPHMLRHSFALRMLVTLTYAFDRRLGLSEAERLEYRHLFGDPWVLVQTMLGHRSLATTRFYYLEPVQGLQVDMFLNDDTDEDSLEQLISRVADTSPRIQDVQENA